MAIAPQRPVQLILLELGCKFYFRAQVLIVDGWEEFNLRGS